MPDRTNNKITHVWPSSKIINPDAQPFSDERESDVWDELRDLTFDDDLRGCIAIVDHEEDGFQENLTKEDVVLSRVKFFQPREVEWSVHRPATEAHSFKRLRSAADIENNIEATTIEVPAEPAYIEKRKETIPFHLGSKVDADALIKQHRNGEISLLVLWYPNESEHLTYLPKVRAACPDLPIYVFHCEFRPDKWGVEREGGAGSWRNDTKTFFELKNEKPVMLIEHLLPEKALTIMAAPSYTGKTHIAIEMGLSLATGTDFLGHFKGPAQSVPVVYHVPELHESLFRDFSERLGAAERLKDNPDNFLVRSLEHDLWQLDSQQMIESSRGRYVFLDTFGYFNDGDDSASYTQAIAFAKKINHLIREGCLGVCGLYHPPKYAKNRKETGNVMTLENQILGSAGYGGVLRSCLGMRNLHDDSNKGLWVYVQGLKNPGLEGPFQIEGVPLQLVKKPGESLYLSELLKDGGEKREQALAMLKENKSRNDICKVLKISSKTLTKWKQEELEFDSDTDGDGV